MQLQMQQILGFPTFYSLVKGSKMPMKTAYKLSRLGAAIDIELNFYREKLHSIINEFGRLDENGNPIPTDDGQGVKLRPGTETQCFAAMKELQEIEVNLPDITFTIDEFDGVELTVEELNNALPFFAD